MFYSDGYRFTSRFYYGDHGEESDDSETQAVPVNVAVNTDAVSPPKRRKRRRSKSIRKKQSNGLRRAQEANGQSKTGAASSVDSRASNVPVTHEPEQVQIIPIPDAVFSECRRAPQCTDSASSEAEHHWQLQSRKRPLDLLATQAINTPPRKRAKKEEPML